MLPTTRRPTSCSRTTGRGHFVEVGALRGCAVDRNGATQASMGLACGDFDGDGWLDLYSTHFYRESNTLYRSLGSTGFEDATGRMGLHLPTLSVLGFGTVMVDFDNDSQQELFVTNGHIDPTKSMDDGGYAMRAQLFSFDGRRWHDQSESAGDHFDKLLVGRGVASCDLDADGDTDLCVVHQNAAVALLENRSQQGNWLQLRPIGVSSDRRGIGTRALCPSGRAKLDAGTVWWDQLRLVSPADLELGVGRLARSRDARDSLGQRRSRAGLRT